MLATFSTSESNRTDLTQYFTHFRCRFSPISLHLCSFYHRLMLFASTVTCSRLLNLSRWLARTLFCLFSWDFSYFWCTYVIYSYTKQPSTIVPMVCAIAHMTLFSTKSFIISVSFSHSYSSKLTRFVRLWLFSHLAHCANVCVCVCCPKTDELQTYDSVIHIHQIWIRRRKRKRKMAQNIYFVECGRKLLFSFTSNGRSVSRANKQVK